MTDVSPCTGRWAPRHAPTVVYRRRLRDRFRRTYWVRCWDCDLNLGPYGWNSARRIERSLYDPL